MQFEFVLVNDSNKDEKVKNHLRQLQSRRRRAQFKERQSTRAALKTTSIVANGPLAFRRKETAEDEDQPESSSSAVGRENSPALRLHPHPSMNADLSTARHSFVESPGSAYNGRWRIPKLPMTTSPLSALSSTRRDPFRTYPIEGGQEVDELFDFFTHDLGPLIFQYTSNASYDLFRDHAALSLLDPASFHNLLFMASMNRDLLAGRSLPGLRFLYHKVQAIRLINERLESNDPERYLSESTIYSVIGLEILKRQWDIVGDQEVSNGIQQLVIRKGGLQLLSIQHPTIEVILYLTAVTTPQILDSGSPSIYFPDGPHLSQEEEESALANQLIEFLETVMSYENMDPALFGRFEFALGRGKGMRELVVSPPPHLYPLGIKDSAFLLTATRLQMMISLYLHCTLLHLMTNDDLLGLADHLLWLMRQEWIWKKSLRMLHYLLVKDKDSMRLSNSAVAWQAVRLGNSTSLLSRSTREMVQTYLLDLLGHCKSARFDMDQIRLELSRYT